MLTGAIVAVMGLIYLGMWRSWQRRESSERLADLYEPPREWVPDICSEGVYASTTRAGRWMERIHQDRLGIRTRSRVCVGHDGIVIERHGLSPFFIPRAGLRGISLAPGIAGKVVGGRGVLVITWLLGRTLVDTGVRLDGEHRRELVAAAMELIDE